ncbi:MAG TPA: mechanosensitive ion channel [Campylobacterales bacterium]|nr:mechanosensitive ion channel [Campylobacterales bacterium]
MLQVTNLDFDSYKGVYAIGKVLQGQVKKGQTLNILEEDELMGVGQAQFVLTSEGLNRVEVEVGLTGDVIAITGVDSIKIGQTLADTSVKTGLPMIKLSEPTLKIHLAPNTSPFAGKEGEFVTIRQIEDRLKREQKTNIGLKIEQTNGGFMIAGRGELHLSVLIEAMRREGFELEIGKPEVIVKEIDGVKYEPLEELTVEIASEYVGVIVEELGKRYGQMLDSITDDKGTARMVFKISSRNLLGFASAGIAIAMKDMFMSLLGWSVIVFGGSIHVGDRIKVKKNGLVYVGDVIDISMLRITIFEDVTLTSYLENRRAGRIIFIPNNYIFTDLIANYTHSRLKTVWDGIDITITFDSNYKKAAHIAKEIARRYAKGYIDITRKQLNRLRNSYHLKNTNVDTRVYTFAEDYGIRVSVWYLTNSYATLTLRSTISTEIVDAFLKEDDIELAYPTQTVALTKDNKIAIDNSKIVEEG